MQWIFVAICFCGTIAAAVFLKSMNLHGGITAAVILSLVLLTIYSMARIRTSKPETEEKAVTDDGLKDGQAMTGMSAESLK